MAGGGGRVEFHCAAQDGFGFSRPAQFEKLCAEVGVGDGELRVELDGLAKQGDGRFAIASLGAPLSLLRGLQSGFRRFVPQ
jgi:hypothetical protein